MLNKPDLIERLHDFVIFVNTFPYHSREVWDKEKGIVRIYGKDHDRKKINYVIYPKKYFDYYEMKERILPQYEDCPLCKIGTVINKYDDTNDNDIMDKARSLLMNKKAILLLLGGSALIPLVLFGIKYYRGGR